MIVCFLRSSSCEFSRSSRSSFNCRTSSNNRFESGSRIIASHNSLQSSSRLLVVTLMVVIVLLPLTFRFVTVRPVHSACQNEESSRYAIWDRKIRGEAGKNFFEDFL